MRLIDAEALENEIVKTGKFVPKDAVLDVACMVNRAPTIEAKPVVHARWENGECSNCKAFITEKNAFLTPYCPFCGAQMEEVTE